MEHKRVLYEIGNVKARWDGGRLENNNKQMYFIDVCNRGGSMFPSNTNQSRFGTPKG